MIVVMQPGATRQQFDAVCERIVALGYQTHPIVGVERTIVGCVGHEDKSPLQTLETMPGVENVIPILKPYKLVSSEFKKEKTIIDVKGAKIGGPEYAIMAGPCSVESEEQIIEVARCVAAQGGQFLRGGAFKPRTSPYAFQGLKEDGLKLLRTAADETGLRVITELVSVTDIDLVVKYADVIQIGARNCQNYALLRCAGESKIPVLLKRGMANTVEEYLMAAEYLMSEGNYDVILCERGIRTFEKSTRFTMDLSMIPVVRAHSHLPVIVDPSHGTGHWNYVADMALAGLAAGGDGLMIEVHPDPINASSDGPQSLRPSKFEKLMERVRKLAPALDRVAPARS
jgi:3-deoxy-7-phosphoheptulonate synthase